MPRVAEKLEFIAVKPVAPIGEQALGRTCNLSEFSSISIAATEIPPPFALPSENYERRAAPVPQRRS
jgi:hypothetical protein